MTTLARLHLPPQWPRALWPFVALLGALLVLYAPTVQGMWAIWSRSETFAHAFVVPPLVLWLVWRKRAELRPLTPRPLPWVLLPMAVLAGVWLLGALVTVNVVTQFALTALLVLAVPAVLGWPVTRVILFPLAFLFFAVPAGDSLTPLLMQWTADFTVLALRASGIPVYREGFQFLIPSGNWSVVEACSGIRYLMASFMVGSLFAYLNYRSTRRRLVFVAVSIIMPIVANWFRAYMIVMLGHLSNNTIATGADHLLYGWVFFGIVIMAMFFIGARWAEPEADLPAASPALRPAPSAPAWPVALGAALLLLLPPLLLPRLADPMAGAALSLSLPARLSAGWVAGAPLATDWKPLYFEPSAQASQSYTGPAGSVGGSVGVRLVYYRTQTDSRKLVNSGNVLVHSTDFHWNLLKTSPRPMPPPNSTLTVNASEILGDAAPGQSDRPRLRVWQFYWVGGRLTHSDMQAKLFSAWQRLSGQGDESAAVLIYALEPTAGAADPLLDSFVQANLPALLQSLQQAAASGQKLAGARISDQSSGPAP